MKLKKALKLIQKQCSEEICCVGICPLACKPKSENVVDCMIDIQLMDSWNVKKINKRVKAMGVGEKALKRVHCRRRCR